MRPILDPKVAGLGPSATLAINERSAELQRQGRRIYRLGFGQSPFPVPRVVVEELRAHASEFGFEASKIAVAGASASRRLAYWLG